MMTQSSQPLEISYKAIIKFFLVLIALIFLYYFRDLLVIVFVAFILSSIMRPGVTFLVRHKWPRKLAVLLFFIVFIGIVFLFFYLLVPVIIRQLSEFFHNLPQYMDTVNRWINSVESLSVAVAGQENYQRVVEAIENNLSSSAGSLPETVANFLGGVARFIVMIAITFYLLIEENAVKDFFHLVIPKGHHEFGSNLFFKIQNKISAWLKGQLILSFIVSALVYTFLSILHIKYALVFAVLAFAGEFFPYVGPILAAAPVVALSFLYSPLAALSVLIFFIVMQQIENHILVPQIMKRAVGLNPLVSIVALFVGVKLAGIVGAIIAVPAAATIMVAIQELCFTPNDINNNTN